MADPAGELTKALGMVLELNQHPNNNNDNAATTATSTTGPFHNNSNTTTVTSGGGATATTVPPLVFCCKRHAIYAVHGRILAVAVSETPDDPAGDADPSLTLASTMLLAIQATKS